MKRFRKAALTDHTAFHDFQTADMEEIIVENQPDGIGTE